MTTENAPLVPDAAPPRSPLTTRVKRQRRCLRNMLLVALGIIAVNAAVTSVLISWKMPATVTFDMKGTIDRFTEQMSAQDSDEKTTRMLTTRFTATLNAALKQWQEKHDALILVRPAVVSGVPDITPEIQADIAQGMSGNKESEDSAIAEH